MLISVWYALEGNYEMAVVSAICALPYVGSMVGGTAGLAIQFVGNFFKNKEEEMYE